MPSPSTATRPARTSSSTSRLSARRVSLASAPSPSSPSGSGGGMRRTTPSCTRLCSPRRIAGCVSVLLTGVCSRRPGILPKIDALEVHRRVLCPHALSAGTGQGHQRLCLLWAQGANCDEDPRARGRRVRGVQARVPAGQGQASGDRWRRTISLAALGIRGEEGVRHAEVDGGSVRFETEVVHWDHEHGGRGLAPDGESGAGAGGEAHLRSIRFVPRDFYPTPTDALQLGRVRCC